MRRNHKRACDGLRWGLSIPNVGSTVFIFKIHMTLLGQVCVNAAKFKNIL